MCEVHNKADEYSEYSKVSRPRMVAQVDHVDLTLTPGDPEHCYVIAVGQTSSSGWTRAQLQARIYITPPADGIYEYDFIAEPPASPANAVMATIMADAHMRRPKELKGVRVYCGNNSMVTPLNTRYKSGVVCIRGELFVTNIEPGMALGTPAGDAYTLLGNLQNFGPDDQVIVCGIPVQQSIGKHRRTINVHWITQDTASPAAIQGRITTPE